MSRAGKFIPGGSNKAKRTGPIRAPDSAPGGGATGPLPSPDGKKRLLSKGKPVAKNQRLPITIMSGITCAVLVSLFGYFLWIVPLKHQKEAAEALAIKAQADLLAEQQAELDRKKHEAELLAAQKSVLSVTTNPPGAMVTVGDSQMTSPAKFSDLIPGDYTVKIRKDGYEDNDIKVTVSADKPVDLGTVNLDAKAGSLSLTSQQSDVTYTLTGPNGYTHDGTVPDKLDGLSIGDGYSLSVAQKDWKLPPISISITDHATTTKDIKFPYAKVAIASTPPGATVRQGRTVLGITPVTLPPQRPGDLHLTVDLPPYTLQRVDLHVTNSANINKQVPLTQDKDFIAACGMPMVWIPDGGYWAAKYPFRQSDFEKVAGYNPSNFRGPNLPVESISWESAQAFINKLNDYEAKSGKVPAGFHYSLPKEVQWDQVNADADMTMAAISSNGQLTSTQNVGFSSPNKYGLYDTIGNVWEWCLDDFDTNGNHTLRGGTWLSLPENFPNAGTRQGGPPKYADKFIGFRVVLVPNV
jgi:hypothetical protein